jgi:hypothetical protein
MTRKEVQGSKRAARNWKQKHTLAARRRPWITPAMDPPATPAETQLQQCLLRHPDGPRSAEARPCLPGKADRCQGQNKEHSKSTWRNEINHLLIHLFSESQPVEANFSQKCIDTLLHSDQIMALELEPPSNREAWHLGGVCADHADGHAGLAGGCMDLADTGGASYRGTRRGGRRAGTWILPTLTARPRAEHDAASSGRRAAAPLGAGRRTQIASGGRLDPGGGRARRHTKATRVPGHTTAADTHLRLRWSSFFYDV